MNKISTTSSSVSCVQNYDLLMIDFQSWSKLKSDLLSSNKNVRHLFYFLIIYLFVWTGLIGYLSPSMYRDSIEEVVWSQTWQWGYYKHPPLPSILLSGLNHLFGNPSIELTIFAAQGCNVIALIYMWLLAKQVLPYKLAIVAVLVSSLIGYHNFRAVVFDHNTVSLPVTAAIWYYFYRAIRRPERIFTWISLGIAAGLAMLTKYSAILVLSTVFIYVLWLRLWSNRLLIRGLLVSILAFTVIFYPNLLWLTHHDWQPFTYLDSELNSAPDRLTILGKFLTGQALRFWYVLLAVWMLKKITPLKHNITHTVNLQKQQDDLQFLLIILLAPLILAMLPTLINGTFLSRNWVTAFFLPIGILLVKYLFSQHDEDALLKNTYRLVLPIQSTIVLIFLGVTVTYPTWAGYANRTNFPSQHFAEKVVDIWQAHTKRPLKIVIAETNLGGYVLLHTKPEPTLLINNDTTIAAWVNREDIVNCGALVLTTLEDKNLPTYSLLFSQATSTGIFSQHLGYAPHEEIKQYAWAVLSPESNHHVCRFNAG